MSLEFSSPAVVRRVIDRPIARTRSAAALAVGAAVVFSLGWGCWSFGIQDNNEGLYAEVAREMLDRGDWVIPHLNGVPYLEKPPVLYWLVAGLMRLLGPHEWVVRLAPALCFAGAAAGLLYIGQLIGRATTGRAAVLILASATGVVIMGRSLLFDVPLMAVLTWMLAMFLRWRITGSRVSLRAAYGLLGLGVMTKGILAVVLGGGAAVVATALAAGAPHFRREPATARCRRIVTELGSVFDGRGTILFLIVAAPWHLLAAARQPGFADFYFINEHLKRFLGTREPHDFYTGPIYYYLERLPMYLGVWTFALLLIVRTGAQRMLGPHSGPAEARRLCEIAVVLALLFFSASDGKANYYLLSVTPALCLLLALSWPEDGMRSRRLVSAPVTVAVFAAVYALAAMWRPSRVDVAMVLRPNVVTMAEIAIALGALSAIMWTSVRRRENRRVLWLTAARSSRRCRFIWAAASRSSKARVTNCSTRNGTRQIARCSSMKTPCAFGLVRKPSGW